MTLSKKLLEAMEDISKTEEYNKIIDTPTKVIINTAQLRRLLDVAFKAKSDKQLDALTLSASNLGHPIESDSDIDQCIFESAFNREEDKDDEDNLEDTKDDEYIEEDITGVDEAPVPDEILDLVEDNEETVEDKKEEESPVIELEDKDKKKKPSQEELNKISPDEHASDEIKEECDEQDKKDPE